MHMEGTARSCLGFPSKKGLGALSNRACLGIAKNNKAKFGPCEGYIEAPRIAQEANALVLIRAYTRQDDVVLLTPLERIHAAHLYLHVLVMRWETVSVTACTGSHIVRGC